MSKKWSDNPRLVARERGLLKGAIRRVFSRSELRRAVIAKSVIEHKDPSRSRVTKWSRCALCGNPVASYQAEVDHISPLIPLDSSFEAMSLDEVVDRTWCPEYNLNVVCRPCHRAKSKQEMKERRRLKNERS